MVSIERIPGRQPLGTRGQSSIRRDDAELDLSRQRLFAVRIPAHVELPLELVDPFLGHVVGGVGRARCDIEEEGMIGRDALDPLSPRDRLVRKVGGQIIIRVIGTGNQVAVLVQDRVPMVHVAGVEAVEVVETQAVRPTVKWPGRAAVPRRRVVVLADPGSHVAVLTKCFCDSAGAARNYGCVAVVASCDLTDHAGRHRVVVAASEKRGPGWAAEGGGMETIETQAFGGEIVHRG